MTITLFPRLDKISVDELIKKYNDEVSLHCDAISTGNLPDSIYYAASGGSPISTADLSSIRNEILDLGKSIGFPTISTSKVKAVFDRELTVYFSELPLLRSPDAHRDDVWAFLTSYLLPDIVVWRFSKEAEQRFHGGVRNAFQRLWLRAKALDLGSESEGRWMLINELTEDALVQIIERPSIGADARLAKAIARGWIEAKARFRGINMEGVMRDAIINIRLRNQIQHLSVLSDDALSLIIEYAFGKAWRNQKEIE